jgi:hypothetical protein
MESNGGVSGSLLYVVSNIMIFMIYYIVRLWIKPSGGGGARAPGGGRPDPDDTPSRKSSAGWFDQATNAGTKEVGFVGFLFVALLQLPLPFIGGNAYLIGFLMILVASIMAKPFKMIDIEPAEVGISVALNIGLVYAVSQGMAIVTPMYMWFAGFLK